jgi:drug/metabolite transporter (DMT)-like permease
MDLLRRTAGWVWRQPYLLLFLTILFWAGNVVVARAVVGDVPPVTLAQIRWAGAFLIILPFAWGPLRRDWPAIRAGFPMLTLLALTGITLYNTIAYWGLQYTQALNAALMQSTAPLLIALWSLVLFRERLSARQALGLAVSLAGVLAIVTRGDPALLLRLDLNVGDVAVLVGLAVYGLYTALLRRRPPISPLSLLAVTIGWGAAMLVPAWLAEVFAAGRTLVFSRLAVFALVYVAVFPSLVAYLFFNRGVELVGANRAGPVFHLFPLFGAILSILFLGERLAPFHALGAALILSGVTLASAKNRVAPKGAAR